MQTTGTFNDLAANAFRTARKSGHLEGVKDGIIRAISEKLGPDSEGLAKVRAAVECAPTEKLAYKAMKKAISARRGELSVSLRDAENERVLADTARRALDEVLAWGKMLEGKGLEIGPIRESALHKLMQDGYPTWTDEADRKLTITRFDRADWQVILIDKDWHKIISQAEVDDGEYRLPYDRCCFEFIASGRRIIVLSEGEDGEPVKSTAFAQTKHGWVLIGQDSYQNLIRAVCIMLEAEVVRSDVVRAPAKLNTARAKRGELPIYDHRTLTLTRKAVSRSDVSAGQPTHKKRLHFRRGHWRHYPNYRVWIKWCLAGDPTLGFVDKDYRV